MQGFHDSNLQVTCLLLIFCAVPENISDHVGNWTSLEGSGLEEFIDANWKFLGGGGCGQGPVVPTIISSVYSGDLEIFWNYPL